MRRSLFVALGAVGAIWLIWRLLNEIAEAEDEMRMRAFIDQF